MKKTNDVFETPSLEREEENLNYGAFVQPTTGRNIRTNQFGFELPVTQINPQFAYSNLPVNIPVVNQQQPYFGYNHPAFQPINLAGGYGHPAFQPVNLAGVATVNPTMGYAVQNPLVGNQFGFQTGFGGNNVPVALAPVQVAGIPMQQPFLSNFQTQPVSFYNPALGIPTNFGTNQEQLTNQPVGQTNLQTQTIPVSYASGTSNGKKDFIGWIPEANILETDKTFRIELAVPGITRETCKVAIDKGILWVSGTRKVDESETKLVNITKKEFSYGSFYRSFLLTENLENEKIQVSCHHGLLTINIPKKELTKKLASEIAVN